MRILFLSAWLPYPPINGAKIRIFNLIRQLSHNHDIALLAFSQTIPLETVQESIVMLMQYCTDVKVVPMQAFAPKGLSGYKGFFSILPRSVVQTHSVEMENVISATLKTRSFDIVIASEVYAPALVSFLASKITGIPKVLDGLEIGLAKESYYKASNLLQRIRCGMTWSKLLVFSKRMLNNSAACTVPSEQEKKNFREIAPPDFPIEVIPHSLDLDYYKSIHVQPVPNSIVFTGSFTYHANLDAVQYFLGEIYPNVRRDNPEGVVKVLGSLNGVDRNTFPNGGSVKFLGLQHDVRPEIANSWVSIVPLRVGAGTRLKIIESMALGTPVVSTSKGAEGLHVRHGENILIADTPQEFSEAVLSVLRSRELRSRLSGAGLHLVREKYSADAMGRAYELLLKQVVQ